MCQNRAKQFLQRYIAMKARAASLIREERDLRIDAQRIRSPELSADRVQTSGSGDGLERSVIKMLDVCDKLEQCVASLYDKMKEIQQAIECCTDERYKTLLTMRYIEGRNWIDICEAMHYEERWIYQLHGLALAEINCWLQQQCSKTQ